MAALIDLRVSVLCVGAFALGLSACAGGEGEVDGPSTFTFGSSATQGVDTEVDTETDEVGTGDTGTGTDTTDSTGTDTTATDTTATDTTDTTSTTDSTDAPELCGNGAIDPGEECDGVNVGGETCVSQGFDSGSLLCDDACVLDTSMCETIMEFCGDGIANDGEACDGADLGGQSCATQGFLFGDLACDGNCGFDLGACGSDTIIDFESGMNPPGFSSGGNANWLVITSQKYEGSWGAASGDINDSQSSWAQVSAQFPNGGSVSFWRRVSSESGWDYGQFLIDGGLQNQWSGTVNWGQASYPVAAGQHTLRWNYSKDGSLSSGEDTYYVDYIVLQGGYVP